MNKYLTDKEKLTGAFEAYKEQFLTDTGLRVEREELYAEIRDMGKAFASCPSADLETINERLDTAERRLEQLNLELEEIHLKQVGADVFLEEVRKIDQIDAFDPLLYHTLVDHMTVKSRKQISVTFRDGTEIEG